MSQSNLVLLSQYISAGKSVTICPPKNKPKYRKSTRKVLTRDQIYSLIKQRESLPQAA